MTVSPNDRCDVWHIAQFDPELGTGAERVSEMFPNMPQIVANRAAAEVRDMHAEWQANIQRREQLFEVPPTLRHILNEPPKPPKQPNEFDVLD